jgi:bisphosphoglycerate-dependent phosphoglycerate mutase
MYGSLQGLNKAEIAKKYGTELKYGVEGAICPPDGESLLRPLTERRFTKLEIEPI